jgi:hypothetical protein
MLRNDKVNTDEILLMFRNDKVVVQVKILLMLRNDKVSTGENIVDVQEL